MSAALAVIECMPYAEYAEHWVDSQECSDLMQDMFWYGNFNAEKMLQVMEASAKRSQVQLTRKDAFDFDHYFYHTYRWSEKGLS